jgi:cell division protein FtsW
MAAQAAAAHRRKRPGSGSRAASRRVAPPLEHRVLMTATLCLLAFGAVMVYSASSPLGVVNGHGLGTGEFFMYLFAAAVGLVLMRVLERRGLSFFSVPVVRVFLAGSFVLLIAVLAPGIGLDINGARRWFNSGPVEFQPSEFMKLALVLYVAKYLADHPNRMSGGFKRAVMPVALAVVPACGLIVLEPDLGTALVVAFTMVALLVAAGMPGRYLLGIAGIATVAVLLLVVAEPYRMSRLASFLHPWAVAKTTGFQSVQGQIAVGSGGIFGVGLGQSIQKIGYVPEAQSDFILAVIGDELGVVGILGVMVLYGMIAYAGLRTARRAATRYAKLLATGLTSLILCQGILNIFVVLGLAPLTGVPLPFISYAPTNLVVMLGSVGVLLNIARPSARQLRAVKDGGGRSSAAKRDDAADRDRRRGDRGARRAGAGGRRRAAG